VGIVAISALLVAVMALAVSITVSDKLAQASENEATRNTKAVIEGFVDQLIGPSLEGHTADEQARINAELASLVGTGQLLRIKVWNPQGTVVYSDLPALRGQNFGVADDLSNAFDGATSAEFSKGEDAENVFERGLASELLSIYLPLYGTSGGDAIGVYEIYEDAGPIVSEIEATRLDVLLIVGGCGAALMLVLFLGFAGASKMLSRQNQLLRSSERRFRSLVHNSADVSMVVDGSGRIAYESDTVERVLGYPSSERVGQPAFAAVQAGDRPSATRLVAEVLKAPGNEASTELRMLHADGSARWIEVVLRNLADDPAVNGVVVNYRDVTTRRTLEDELRHQAFHDSLTGLANRALFLDRLQHAMARQRGFATPLAVLFIDIDDFKTINDSLGHGEGDALLVAVAQRLRDVLRSSDTIARMGGDEFAILVEDSLEADAAMEVARRLLAALEAPFGHGTKDHFVRASVGLTVRVSSDESPEDMLRNADIAMYTAKSNGKNRIETYQPEMHAAAMTRQALRADLERAMERNEFYLVYQPIVCLTDERPTGVEALLRWRHPERGVVNPLEFVPLAEETGLIVKLGRWVLEEACRQVRAWDELSGVPRVTVNVNVSARQLQEPDFVAQVAEILAATRLDPKRLTLEFTESLLLRDTELTISKLHALKALGLRLSIDDFGTGYSSLSYLRRLPIDELKIDGSFIAGMASEPGQMAVVRSIVDLAETLHLETVAEGIEGEAQLQALRGLSAQMGQGFLFSKPLSAEELPRALTQRTRWQAALPASAQPASVPVVTARVA
jgi:diguanylate cyclase (GGDEF)-like protein/PAS domain S-box-containing protein